jgi:transposase
LDQIVAVWGNSRPLRLMFQDEARFGRISDTRYCWCRRPARPLVRAMVTQQYTYAYGAVSPQDGRFDSLVLPHVNSGCMQIFLDEIASRYPNDNVVMVLDGAGWHKSKGLCLPGNLRLLFLPPYSPELNPQEHLWDELREKHFNNRVFDSIDVLEDHLVAALRDLENAPGRIKSITGWDWIINVVSNAN